MLFFGGESGGEGGGEAGGGRSKRVIPSLADTDTDFPPDIPVELAVDKKAYMSGQSRGASLGCEEYVSWYVRLGSFLACDRVLDLFDELLDLSVTLGEPRGGGGCIAVVLDRRSSLYEMVLLGHLTVRLKRESRVAES